MINEYLAKKILLVIFPFLNDDENRVYTVIDHTGMLPGKIRSYEAAYESDDNLKFVVTLYTEESHVEPSITAYSCKKNDDDDDTWDIEHDLSKEAAMVFDELNSKTVFSSEKNGFCLRVANDIDINKIRCPICFTEFTDVSPEIMRHSSDSVDCLVCNTKLNISRNIKIVYDIDINKNG